MAQVQLTFSLHGTIIYDWFLQLKCVITYAYMAQSFANNFVIKNVGMPKFFYH
jgi:hypothetical protein